MAGVPGAEMSGRVIPADRGDEMTAEDSTQTEPVRSETDLKLEALEARIAGIEEAHAKQIEELTEANRGLWAALHPVQQDAPAPVEPSRGEAAYQALADKLGLEAKE